MKNLRIIYIALFVFVCTHVSAQSTQQKTLADYQEIAKVNSPLLKDYKNQSQISDFELERLKSLYKRSNVTVSGGFLFVPIISTDDGKTAFKWNAQQADHYYGYDLNQANGNLSGIVTWTQPLLGGASYKASAVRVSAEKAVNENNINLGIHDLEKLVSDQYILCLLDKQKIDFSNGMDSLLVDQLSISEKLAKQGLLKQTDLSLLQIEKMGNDESVAENKQSYYSDLLDLNILCGIHDTTQINLEEVTIPLKNIPLVSSHYLEKFKLDSIQIVSKQKESETEYRPQLNLFANAGLQATYLYQIPQRFGMSAGLTFSWTIFDGYQKKINAKISKVALNTNAIYRDSFMTQNEVRKQKCISEIMSYEKRQSLVEKQLGEYDRLLDNYKKLMASGQLSVIDYITVLKNRSQLKRDYLLLKANRLLLTNAYNYWNW